ncbi:hypothetical protein [Polaribacter dokdonensis]|uniref:Magnesium citrate secondary transporter n=1 Tax=Polaribacter dokdonensis DSW-5 TaxID=1300348 RepID=A0A1H5HA93_9FLAO|nr:hypothetical protein [Polaribacter dokdonensis]SEE24892.1 hypothetical protein SAMN05444353_1388 [Polaribacter dokdonensis DSW-5]
MNLRLRFFCILSLFIGTVIYCLQYFNVPLPNFLNNYLNDFLIIPIALFICLLFLRWSRNDSSFTLKLPVILYLCSLYSLIFEFILPQQLTRYTADPIDVILYFLGGFTFYLLQNKPSRA